MKKYKKTIINVEKGELEIDPTTLQVKKDFKYKPVHPITGINPDGNVKADVGDIIIPRKYRIPFQEGSFNTRELIASEVVNNQGGQKYATGGGVGNPRTPLPTTDPSKVKAYQDSLANYKYGLELGKDLIRRFGQPKSIELNTDDASLFIDENNKTWSTAPNYNMLPYAGVTFWDNPANTTVGAMGHGFPVWKQPVQPYTLTTPITIKPTNTYKQPIVTTPTKVEPTEVKFNPIYKEEYATNVPIEDREIVGYQRIENGQGTRVTLGQYNAELKYQQGKTDKVLKTINPLDVNPNMVKTYKQGGTVTDPTVQQLREQYSNVPGLNLANISDEAILELYRKNNAQTVPSTTQAVKYRYKAPETPSEQYTGQTIPFVNEIEKVKNITYANKLNEEERQMAISQKKKALEEYYSQPGMISGVNREPDIQTMAERGVDYNKKLREDPIGTLGPDIALSILPEIAMLKGPSQAIGKAYKYISPFGSKGSTIAKGIDDVGGMGEKTLDDMYKATGTVPSNFYSVTPKKQIVNWKQDNYSTANLEFNAIAGGRMMEEKVNIDKAFAAEKYLMNLSNEKLKMINDLPLLRKQQSDFAADLLKKQHTQEEIMKWDDNPWSEIGDKVQKTYVNNLKLYEDVAKQKNLPLVTEKHQKVYNDYVNKLEDWYLIQTKPLQDPSRLKKQSFLFKGEEIPIDEHDAFRNLATQNMNFDKYYSDRLPIKGLYSLKQKAKATDFPAPLYKTGGIVTDNTTNKKYKFKK